MFVVVLPYLKLAYYIIRVCKHTLCYVYLWSLQESLISVHNHITYGIRYREYDITNESIGFGLLTRDCWHYRLLSTRNEVSLSLMHTFTQCTA
jgi:hypothetical protein